MLLFVIMIIIIIIMGELERNARTVHGPFLIASYHTNKED